MKPVSSKRDRVGRFGLRSALAAALLLGASRAHAFFWFTGGPVIDIAQIAQMGQQYVAETNKLNLLNAQNATAEDQLAALTALEQDYGTGGNVTPYTPSTITVDPNQQNATQAYAATLPDTAEGQSIAAFMKRQQEREDLIATYSARLAAVAALQGKQSLSLQELATVENSLASAGMDARLSQIQAQADASGLNAAIRVEQLKLREYQAAQGAIDAATSK